MLAEQEVREVTACVGDDGGDADLVAGDRERERCGRRGVQSHDRVQMRRAGGPQQLRKLRRRALREVGAPAVDVPKRVRGQRKQREIAAARSAHEAGVAQHGRSAAARQRLLDRHEPRQVLAEDVRRRHREARLLMLSLHERRAIRDREDGDADAEDEEDDGERDLARRAREREQRDADGRRRTARAPFDRA